MEFMTRQTAFSNLMATKYYTLSGFNRNDRILVGGIFSYLGGNL